MERKKPEDQFWKLFEKYLLEIEQTQQTAAMQETDPKPNTAIKYQSLLGSECLN